MPPPLAGIHRIWNIQPPGFHVFRIRAITAKLILFQHQLRNPDNLLHRLVPDRFSDCDDRLFRDLHPLDGSVLLPRRSNGGVGPPCQRSDPDRVPDFGHFCECLVDWKDRQLVDRRIRRDYGVGDPRSAEKSGGIVFGRTRRGLERPDRFSGFHQSSDKESSELD